ncbi:MAG: DUF2442 domain-containing protein [Syntrophomonas sp.]|nr:DUF2442 domain-containing protein [Syntrophomonas sp.]
MSKIVKVIPFENYTLEIELDNCHRIIYDMKSRLQAVRFCDLIDLEKFQSVRVENGDTVVWDSLRQITLHEIMRMVEK